MSNSARSREAYQNIWQPAIANRIVATGDTGTIQLLAAKASHTLYVQSILVSCTTGAAQTLSFQGDTGVLLARTKATGIQGESYLFDFGPEGFPLTVDDGLDMVISGAGLGAAVHIEGYYRLTAIASA